MSLTAQGKRPRQRIQIGKRNAAVLAGLDDLSDWDDEELMRGQKRARNGTFQGTSPTVVPKALHDELVRRKMSEAHALLRDNLVAATEVLVSLANGKDVDDAVRLRAVTLIMDRVLGKTPETVNVSVQKTPFQTTLDKIFIDRQSLAIDVESREA